MQKQWLRWAKELQSIAQAGLAYSKDKYDMERFQQIRDLSVEILDQYTDMDHGKIKDLFCGETGYQTPKVDIRGAIFKDDRILLVKESTDGCWAMPGGWAEVGLSVRENVMKEAKEEAGACVVPKRIIAIQDRNRHNEPVSAFDIYKIFVLCDWVEGKFEENIETEDYGFFTLSDLPALSVGRNTKEQIQICFEAQADERAAVVFD